MVNGRGMVTAGIVLAGIGVIHPMRARFGFPVTAGAMVTAGIIGAVTGDNFSGSMAGLSKSHRQTVLVLSFPDFVLINA